MANSVVVTPIEEGFQFVDGENGARIRQCYDVDFLQGPAETWIDQARAAEGFNFPKPGDVFSAAYPDAICRDWGLVEIKDSHRAIFFAIFRRGRWGPGGYRKLSQAINVSETQLMPYYMRVHTDQVVGPWKFIEMQHERVRSDRIETRYVQGDANLVNVIQRALADAVGYIYRIGGAFGQDYLSLGGKADTDGRFSVRISYKFSRWNAVDSQDPSLGDADIDPIILPSLGAFQVWSHGTNKTGTRPWIKATLNPLVRTSGIGPMLWGIQ